VHNRLTDRDPVAGVLHDLDDLAFERRAYLTQVELNSSCFILGMLGVRGQTGNLLFADGLFLLS